MDSSKHEVINPSERLLSWIYIHKQDAKNVAPHWHRSIELSYTQAGSIDSFAIGNQNFSTKPGDILLVNSQEIHSITVNPYHSAANKALTITFPYHFVMGQYPAIDRYLIAISDPSQFSNRQKQVYAKLQSQLEDIISLYEGKDELRVLKINSLLLQILTALLQDFLQVRNPSQSIKGQLQVAERLQELTSYVDDHYQEPIGLADMAERLHLSKTYLARFIKQHLGVTLGEYIGQIRAQHARRDLIETSDSLTAIALKNGFSGLRTMNRALIKHFSKDAKHIRKESEGRNQ